MGKRALLNAVPWYSPWLAGARREPTMGISGSLAQLPVLQANLMVGIEVAQILISQHLHPIDFFLGG